MKIFVMAGGRFRGALFHGTRFVNRMRLQHNLGILETQVLGQACLCGALLIPTMKGRENLNFRYDTNGPAAGFCVNADSKGYVRGYLLQNPIPLEKPLENWDLSPFFGDGSLTISRLPEGAREFQTGTVEIMHRNIARDLTWYFEQSEQTKTAFNTSIMMDKAGRVIGAGGLFLQKMPGFGGNIGDNPDDEFSSMDEEELLERVEHAFASCPSLGQWFSEKGDLEDIIFGLFRDFKPSIAVTRDIKFDCPCSKETFISHIKNLNPAEVADIKKNGPDPLEVICHNCGSVYNISVSELG
ncbi:MAG: Hsp33 family molecular chaperone HslO [Treponemataceae bacterium]|nr:Hsp33 family molecular chaperone HslO [Treponemataceae bacterium]